MYQPALWPTVRKAMKSALAAITSEISQTVLVKRTGLSVMDHRLWGVKFHSRSVTAVMFRQCLRAVQTHLLPVASCPSLTCSTLPFHKPSCSSKHLKLAAQSGSVWRLARKHATYTRISNIVKFRLKGPKNILKVYFCTVLVCARDKQTLFKMKSPHHVVFLIQGAYKLSEDFAKPYFHKY